MEKSANYNNDIFAEFENFNDTNSEFNPPKDDETVYIEEENDNKENLGILNNDLISVIIISFIIYAHSKFYSFIFKKKIPEKVFSLDSEEEQTVKDCLNQFDILKEIRRLPSWVFPILQIEFIFYRKFSEYYSQKK